MASPARTTSALIVLGVGWTWFYNGANFLAFKIGGDAFHPLMLAALRFGIAAIAILPLAAWRWRRNPALSREIAGAALLGPVMLIGSQTLAIWGTHFLPAGVASVFGSATPLFLALFAWAFLHELPGRRQIAGIALGIAGLAAIAWLSWSGTGFRLIGAIMTLAASATWAGGSLVIARLRMPKDPVIGLAAQLAPTGTALGLTVWLAGLTASFDPASIPLQAWEALAFLTVASTLTGYAVFLALNRSASPILANSFNYAAPVIALGLAAWLLGEPVGWGKFTAAGVTLGGVALMIGGRSARDDPQMPNRPAPDQSQLSCT